MEKNSKTKNIVLGVLLVAVLTLSIAYAALSATLTINAQATVKGANWDVHFQAKSGQTAICTASSTGATTTAVVKKQPTLDLTSFSGLEAEFKLPGDKVVCTWEVTNAGSIDAKLATVTKPTVAQLTYTGKGDAKTSDENTVKSNFIYDLSINNAAPTVGDKLPATTGNTKTVTLTIEYDSNATAIPVQDVVVTKFDTTLVYQQN